MKRKLYQYSLYLLAFSLCFPENWSSKTLIFASILGLFNVKSNRDALKTPFLVILVSLVTYVIFNIAFISQALDSRVISLIGLLILFFFLFNYTVIEEATYIKIPLVFSLGVFLVGILNFFPFLIKNSLSNLELLSNSWNTYAIIDIHKIYYALFLCLSYVFVINYVRLRLFRNRLLYNGLSFLFCVVMLYYTGSTNGFLLFIISHLFLMFTIFKPKIRYFFSLSVLILPILLLFIMAIPRVQKVFSKIDGEGSRMRNYNINKELFFEAPIFGYGLGNERDIMQEKRNPRSWEYKNNYNAHNQYFESLVGGGLVLLSILLSFIVVLIYKSILVKFNLIELCFCAFTLYSFLIESILVRHHGIFFFSFFLIYLQFWVNKNKKEV